MLLLGLWRTRWLIWIDRTLQFAPNPGFGKAVINLNTVWAALIGVIFLKGKMNARQILGDRFAFKSMNFVLH